MKKVLLTGYGPFANTPMNPAELVAQELNGTRVHDAEIVSHIAPVEFFQCIESVTDTSFAL
ncbi:pyroglutamyl-peptidase I family protein [Piscirickettsia litoralis]|uniref:Pyrrolidone-carboxylate peptidase n=1 Tax=Piscirickettsia litoralis TaxID=1891921 RepID=A0ABX2ZZE6_9GAMM|nr:hypothetical protein [Piscirickettsia litoralis]ODN41893.1 hypothetical protein BGC07_01580 [Piscirickettsia litoralis]